MSVCNCDCPVNNIILQTVSKLKTDAFINCKVDFCSHSMSSYVHIAYTIISRKYLQKFWSDIALRGSPRILHSKLHWLEQINTLQSIQALTERWQCLTGSCISSFSRFHSISKQSLMSVFAFCFDILLISCLLFVSYMIQQKLKRRRQP